MSGSGGLVKTGRGMLTLSGSNTFSGGTTVSGGTLSISSDGNLGSPPATVTPASISVHQRRGASSQRRYAVQYRDDKQQSRHCRGHAGGTINVAFAATGTFATNEIAVQYRGVISGSGNLTVTGGTGTNSGDNPYLLEWVRQTRTPG